MSDAVKKPNQTPESYSPKKPEIVGMAEMQYEAADIAYFANYNDGEIDSFETDCLIIRHFKENDWKDLQQIAQSKENSEFADFDTPWPTDDEGIQGACNYFSTGKQFWAVEVKDISKVVAFINFNGVNDSNEMDIGHVMNDAYFNRNYEYEALAVLYDFCFRDYNVDAICAGWVMPDKKKLEPLERLGMELINTGKAQALHENPDFVKCETEGCKAIISRATWEDINSTSYQPKKPEILNMAEDALKSNAIAFLPFVKMIDNILSPDEPWVGGCRYLLCFTPLYMHLERHNTNYYSDESTREDFNGNYGLCGEECDLQALNRERVYKVFLTATGMGLVNHWSKTGQHQNYEMAKDYIARSMRFAGYDYDILADTDENSVMNTAKRMINADIPVLVQYESGWELIVGYNETDNTLTLRKGGGTVDKKDFTDGLKHLVCVTDTNREKSDLTTVVSDIIETMETSGDGTGMNGYYDAIDFLQNDKFFDNGNNETLNSIKQSLVWGYFISHAEARGFSGIGFEWRFFNRYETDEKTAELYNKISYYGDQHHQIAWCGDSVCKMYGGDIRSKELREKLITIIYYLMENDMIVCRLLKQLIGLDTPDVITPRDRKTGKLYSTQIAVRDDITADEMLSRLKVKNTVSIDFIKDIEESGNVHLKLENGLLQVKSCNNVYDQDGIALKKATTYPFKVDMRVKTDSMNIHLYYGNAYISLRQHPHCLDSLWIRDMLIGLYLGYPDRGIVPIDKFIDLTWIVHRDFMAVIVNGEVHHYGSNYPYMNVMGAAHEKFRFGTASGSTITVEKLAISELE